MASPPGGNSPNREKANTTLQFFLDKTEWSSQSGRPKRVDTVWTVTPPPVRLYPGGVHGAWTGISQQGGPQWCLHVHFGPPGGYSLRGIPHTQGYIKGIPTSRLPPAYPNGMCVISTFILRSHRYGKGPGQQHHTIVWWGTSRPSITVRTESSFPENKNPGTGPN